MDLGDFFHQVTSAASQVEKALGGPGALPVPVELAPIFPVAFIANTKVGQDIGLSLWSAGGAGALGGGAGEAAGAVGALAPQAGGEALAGFDTGAEAGIFSVIGKGGGSSVAPAAGGLFDHLGQDLTQAAERAAMDALRNGG